MKYKVVKTLSSRPGPMGGQIPQHPSFGTSNPETSVVMSRHSRRDLAEKAMSRYVRDHRGYAQFHIEEAG